MGSVFKKTYTKPLPGGAETFTRGGKRFARWKPEGSKTRTAQVTVGEDGSERLLVRAGTFTAKYRDGNGHVIERPTGCRDEGAARAMLTEFERRAELVRAGVLTSAQDSIADHQAIPLDRHITAYIDNLKLRNVNEDRRKTTEKRLNRIAADCHFSRLSDLAAEPVERWLLARKGEGVSAAVRNGYRECCVAFANWCRRTSRLVDNPFLLVAKADVRSDPRRKRRALTEKELLKLLEEARRRPLLERSKLNRGPKKGEEGAELSKATRERLDLLGFERALIYKALVLTGLRRGELASLTVGQLELDGLSAWATLHAADEKNRQGSQIPLRADLAEDLKDWLDRKLRGAQAEALRRGEPIPVRLAPDTPLFRVPSALVKILNRDLTLAEIPKRDERGRTVDVHALRHTFGTHLSKGGVPLRTAQAAMRHSDPSLTANVYTDPKLLDVAKALEALPRLPLEPRTEAGRERATGTCPTDSPPPPLAPALAPNPGFSGASGSIPDKTAVRASESETDEHAFLSGAPVEGSQPLASAVKAGEMVGVIGFEPTTSASRTKDPAALTGGGGEVTGPTPAACTGACTGNPDSTHSNALAALAEAINRLSPEEAARLAQLLHRRGREHG